MDSQISTTLARYKLHAIFDGDSVEHTTHRSDLQLRQRRVVVKTRWTREKELGSGAFGIVWREREAESKELRAVKIIPKRFLNVREVEALAELQDHPDLFVSFFGWFEDRDSIYLAMEYLEHGDLGEYIREYPAQAKGEAQAIATQILEGLVVLHERGICHRDLKPQNILIASIAPIWVKISDFGISKRTVGTALNTMCGTIIYQAPELLGMLPRHMKKGNRYTVAVDLWALGVVIHQVLTTQIPFLETWNETDINTDLDTGLTLCMEDQQPQLDATMLYGYCNGSDPFPVQSLKMNGVHEEGIDFVKSLMVVNPADRASAKDALSCLLEIRVFCRLPELKLLNPFAVVPSHPVGPGQLIVDNGAFVDIGSEPRTIPTLQVLDRDNCEAVSPSRTMAEPLEREVKYNEALEWDARALAGTEGALGVDYPDMLTAISKLVDINLPERWRDLEVQEHAWGVLGSLRALGEDHPNTLSSISEIGKAYYKQGMYDKAVEWYGRALAGRERARGVDHPDTLTMISKIAGIHSKNGEYDQAVQWHKRALAGRKRTLGEDHPDTLAVIMKIGRLYDKQEMYDNALEWHERALAGRERALGLDHPDTLIILTQMVTTLRYQGPYKQSLKRSRRVLECQERILGKDHPHTQKSAVLLEAAIQIQGKQNKASREELGKLRPDTRGTGTAVLDIEGSSEESNSGSGISGRIWATFQNILGPENKD